MSYIYIYMERLFLMFLITHNDAPQSVGLLWTSDQLVAETSTWQHTTFTTDKTPMPPVGFEPTIPADERPQTHTLDRGATGIGKTNFTRTKIHTRQYVSYVFRHVMDAIIREFIQ